jgi:hypothetical protein
LNPTVLPYSKQNVFIALLAAATVPGALFLLSWNFGFDPGDEGYYWYGAQRILHGEMPIRDYMSYDIGRYYWTAAVMYILADSGIYAARVSALLFQCLTVAVALFLCLWGLPRPQSLAKRALVASLVALTLTIWTTPYYKAFDHGASILVVAMLVVLLKTCNSKAWLLAGLLLGIAAIIGRNHGVYGAAAASFALLWILGHGADFRQTLRPAAAFIFGVVLSFSPTFLLMVWAPGFGEAFVESIRVILRASNTNIPLPIPWPWHFDPRTLGWVTWAAEFLRGSMFVLILPVVAALILSMRRRSISDFGPAHLVLMAASLAALPYSHYAYSRAEVFHLALSMIPLVIALAVAGGMLNRPILASTGLLLFTIISLSDTHPVLNKYLRMTQYQEVEISGHKITTLPGIAEQIVQANEALNRHPEARQSFLALPNMPSLHAMHRVKMAIWETYSLTPREASFEQAELMRLRNQHPEMILISNHALDQREEFRYSRLRPAIYAWVNENYTLERRSEALPDSNSGGLEIYLKKTEPSAKP